MNTYSFKLTSCNTARTKYSITDENLRAQKNQHPLIIKGVSPYTGHASGNNDKELRAIKK